MEYDPLGSADAWADIGYEPHDSGPPPPPTSTVCPFCGRDGAHDVNTSPTGGLVCGGCFAVFHGTPGEVEAHIRERALWSEATRRDAA
jgi:hypothetical protein